MAEVDPEGAAAQKGIQTGDVILAVGGKSVSHPSDVAAYLVLREVDEKACAEAPGLRLRALDFGVKALLEKGAALGTTLAFVMAVIGLSLPETIILRKVLKWQLIAVFIGVVAAGITITGYLFNIVL